MVEIGEFQRRWENRRARARTAGDEARESYYGLPVIHKPHWDWWIIVYFFVGGICGAANAIATLARWHGGDDGKEITRVGRYLSFAMLLPSTVCLIMDLGRPERFINMLRILKLRSPMSVGTWILVSSSFFISLLTLDQAREDGLLGRSNRVTRLVDRLPLRLLDAAGVVPSLCLASYTGVLLAATAVPIWARNYLVMGPLFLASAFSTAAAAIGFILGLRGNRHSGSLHRVERVDRLAMIAEVLLLLVFRRQLSPTIATPLESGTTGKLHRYGVMGAGLGIPLALHSPAILRRKHMRSTTSLLASLLVLAGGFMFRYVMVMAGHRSADDPKATFEATGKRGE